MDRPDTQNKFVKIVLSKFEVNTKNNIDAKTKTGTAEAKTGAEAEPVDVPGIGTAATNIKTKIESKTKATVSSCFNERNINPWLSGITMTFRKLFTVALH